MSDLIDRQQAIDVLEEQLDYLFMLNKKDNPTAESKWYGVNWARNTIAELPSAEPKVGKWIDGEREGYNGTYCYRYCSECLFERNDDDADKDTPYCPNCGAKMERSE